MQALRFVGGILCMVVCAVTIYSIPKFLSGEEIINQAIVDSPADRFFFVLMAGGMALFYGLISVVLFRGVKASQESAVTQAATIIIAIASLAGLYYHVIFGSPW